MKNDWYDIIMEMGFAYYYSLDQNGFINFAATGLIESKETH